MARVAVLGGGISGLACAHYLAHAPATKIKRVALLEGSGRLGGFLQTSRFDDVSVFEHGPRNLTLTGRPGRNTLLLAEELGLEADIVTCTKNNKDAGTPFIYVNGHTHKVPNSLGSLVTRQPPFTRSVAAQCWKEPFTKSIKKDDESIDDFITRRLGNEVAKYLFDPIGRSIFQGSSRELSMKACFKDIFNMEQEYGSIIKGAIRAPKDKSRIESDLLKRAKSEKWKTWSTREGLQKLPEVIQKQLMAQTDRVTLHLNAPCRALHFPPDQGPVKVRREHGEDHFDHVFAAIPAPRLADLLGSSEALSDVKANLSLITANSCGVVSLQYEGNILPRPGLGHLIPSFEPSKVSCILYESCSFPQHGARDRPTTRLMVLMGGSEFEELFGDVNAVREGVLADTALAAVRDQLGVRQEPMRLIVRLLKECLPQYVVGHTARVDAVMADIEKQRLPLSLIGAGYRGITVNDCIWNARTAVDEFLTTLH